MFIGFRLLWGNVLLKEIVLVLRRIAFIFNREFLLPTLVVLVLSLLLDIQMHYLLYI